MHVRIARYSRRPIALTKACTTVAIAKSRSIQVFALAARAPSWTADNAHDARIAALSFRPDSEQLASADVEGRIKVWNHTPPKPIWILEHGSEVTSLTWLPDNNGIISGGFGELHIWDIQTGSRTMTIVSEVGPVRSVSVFRDGSKLLVGGNNGVQIVRLSDGSSILIDFPESEGGSLVYTRSGFFSGDADLFSRVMFRTGDMDIDNLSSHDRFSDHFYKADLYSDFINDSTYAQ